MENRNAAKEEKGKFLLKKKKQLFKYCIINFFVKKHVSFKNL